MTAFERASLPVDDVLPELLAALRRSGTAVLRAPAGAGKTTRVPPAILDDGIEGRVVVTEPRRIAARAAARRIAEERGGRVGDEVGWRVRFDRREGKATRLLVVTEGVFLRMLAEDPLLTGVGAVVLDEVHERSLPTDLSLALARRVRDEVRPDLRVVAMSATVDTGPFSEYLGGAPVVASDGGLHPVEVRHLEQPDRRRLPELVAIWTRRALAATDGDVLAFLPGVGEIRRTAEWLDDVPVVPLYGDLPLDQQDAALRPGTDRRVVLATNVAETSVTVPGVTAVVDSGYERVSRFDPAAGLARLDLVRIGRSSADQRAGRAGRTGPGICFRLWTEHADRELADDRLPEIRRTDLAGAVLELFRFGETDPIAFPWFEPPEPSRTAAALDLLERLGAVRGGRLTEEGREMAALPTHPRLARLLLEGARRGHGRRAALAAAVVSERDPFGRRDRRADLRSDSDVLDRVVALETGELRSARFLLRVRDQLARLVRHVPVLEEGDADEAVLRALWAAYSDRLCRRRRPGDSRGVMVDGAGVKFDPRSAVLDAELFVAVSAEGAREGERAERLVRMASAVRREWLPEAEISREEARSFDEDRETVVAVRRTLFRGLVLDEIREGAPRDARTAEALAVAAAADRLDRALPLGAPDTARFLARVRSLRGWMPELDLPALDEADLRDLLPGLCAGKRSFEELRRSRLLDFLRGRLTWPQQQALDRHAPERIETPSGAQLKLTYEPGRPPVLAARIQQMFGATETPAVGGGRVKVLLHLLAPNGRPQQVTDDLPSFWENTYAQVRKDLRARYPKHAWPVDPTSSS